MIYYFERSKLEEYVLLLYTADLEAAFPQIKDKGGLVNRSRLYQTLLSVLHLEVLGIAAANDLMAKVSNILYYNII